MTERIETHGGEEQRVEHRLVPETTVPADATDVAQCPYCGQPFTTARLRDLHVGEEHDPTEAERAAYDEAFEAESEDLFVYHLKVAGALSALYAALFLLGIVGFSM
ncbi:hypothetical protein ACFQJC_07955 [Haloferax namakaokahaiae]|uniref:C2H2-type domain-containing protein n=1 Tax=Haloferax namakaokahaiae TaxID=1748331 RepID=A0ABD5ZEM8_9EURY